MILSVRPILVLKLLPHPPLEGSALSSVNCERWYHS